MVFYIFNTCDTWSSETGKPTQGGAAYPLHGPRSNAAEDTGQKMPHPGIL